MNQTRTHRATSDARESSAYSDYISEELHRYEDHLRDVRGLVEAYCRQQARIVGRLLHKKFADRPINITELIAEDVRRFLANQLDALRTPSNALQLASALRSYFRYRTTCGDQVDKLTAAVSSPAHWKLASLPRALKPEEAERLLNSLTVNLRFQKRGYAIVRCALDMGLRAGEIAHLMINDIDWRAGTVMLRGTKSLRQDIMPLPMETGQALADYLQHERPATRNPAIFVRQMKGRDYPITSTAIQKVIKRACRRVDLPHTSAHSLRHTLACRLVESGSSLKEVADLLRHRSLTTTLIYAKLDTPKLLAVALPWPGSKL
jgi:site-specific recombinase XerD